MAIHEWEEDGVQGGHRGEYYYKCTKCGLTDWLAYNSEPSYRWHSDSPCATPKLEGKTSLSKLKIQQKKLFSSKGTKKAKKIKRVTIEPMTAEQILKSHGITKKKRAEIQARFAKHRKPNKYQQAVELFIKLDKLITDNSFRTDEVGDLIDRARWLEETLCDKESLD